MLVAEKLFQGKTKQTFFVWMSYIAIGLLVGLRSTSVGADTANYYSMYSLLANATTNTNNLETGFIWLVKLLYWITPNPQMLFILQGTLVAVSGALFVMHNTTHIHEAYIAILAFLAFHLFSFHLSGIRQSIAMSICLFAYKEIKAKRVWRFLLIVIGASFFHQSAFFFLPAYFLANANEKISKFVATVGTVASILLLEQFMNFFSLFSERFEKYGIEETGNGYIFFAVVMLITFVDTVFQSAISQKTGKDAIHSKINYVCAGMWILRLFTRVIERVSFFYLPSTMMVVAHTHGAMKTSRDRKLYTGVLSILLMVLYLYRMSAWHYSFC